MYDRLYLRQLELLFFLHECQAEFLFFLFAFSRFFVSVSHAAT